MVLRVGAGRLALLAAAPAPASLAGRGAANPLAETVAFRLPFRIACLVFAACVPAAARAIPAPGADSLALLAARCASASVVRVVAAGEVREARRVTLGPEGVRMGVGLPQALITLGAPTDPAPIAWRDLEALAIGRAWTWEGARAGLLLGGTLGAGAVAALGSDLTDAHDHVVLLAAVGSAVGGLLLGALVGSGSIHWTTLVP